MRFPSIRVGWLVVSGLFLQARRDRGDALEDVFQMDAQALERRCHRRRAVSFRFEDADCASSI